MLAKGSKKEREKEGTTGWFNIDNWRILTNSTTNNIYNCFHKLHFCYILLKVILINIKYKLYKGLKSSLIPWIYEYICAIQMEFYTSIYELNEYFCN